MVERNAGVPEDRRIEFRIGVHLGDVVEEADGDLMGDGVNIAARLEGIAEPGAPRYALDDFAAAARRRAGPGERQYPVLPVGDDRLAQNNFDPRRAARDGFIKALRDAHRWLDELLYDPTQTIESLAVRESKSERSIRMTLSLAFISPVLAEAAMGGRLRSVASASYGARRLR